MPRRTLHDRLYPEPRAHDKFELNPTFEPNGAYLRDVQHEATKRRAEWNRSWNRILQLIPPHDASTVKECGKTLVRFHNPKTSMDLLITRLCYNYYCPTCPNALHWTRTTYHARKLASFDPSEKEPLPRVINLVFTLPPQLHAWARLDPRVIPVWRKSVMKTIGQAYGYKGRQGCPVERAAFRELGAIINLHAIGDKATPWPKWAPHLDIIMPAWKRCGEKIMPLRVTWPERFITTRKHYCENLRHFLLPLARAPNVNADLIAFLQTDFETVWNVSRPPRTPSNPDRKGIVHVESAMHRIRYSCRPLFVLQNARATNIPGKGEQLVYSLNNHTHDKRVRHVTPLGPALGQLESIREWMTGRKARTQVGILSKRTYDESARLAGHEPVRERARRGLVHKATYEMGPDRDYTKITRAPPPAPAEHDDESDEA